MLEVNFDLKEAQGYQNHTWKNGTMPGKIQADRKLLAAERRFHSKIELFNNTSQVMVRLLHNEKLPNVNFRLGTIQQEKLEKPNTVDAIIIHCHGGGWMSSDS